MEVASAQPGLFDTGSRGDAVYFLTNRNNLLRILAAGQLMPVSGFAEKYYDDLLRLAPGRLPLLASGSSADLTGMVMPEAQAFPVVLEIDHRSLVDAGFPALMADGSHDSAGWANPDARMWAPSGSLPFADVVVAIHFRSDGERKEFEARDFADARPQPALHRVTPSLFDADGPSADAATEWLRSLEALDAPAAPDVNIEDRRSGALLLGTMTAIPDESELQGWGQLLAGKKPGRHAGDVVSRIGRALEGAARARDPEDVALQVCLEELAATNPAVEWRAVETLGRIREKLAARLKTKVDSFRPALDRAEAILRGEEPFEGLKPGGSSTLKALLLALMRPEPERLMGWEPGGAGSTEEVINLAATMVGELKGRAMTPVALRPAPLDDALARIEADRLSTSRDRAMRPFKAPAVAVEHTADGLDLKVGGVTIVTRPTRQPIEQTIEVDVALLEDPAVRERAVEIAAKNGWLDCIETVVEAFTTEIRTTLSLTAGGPTTIRLSGLASVSRELVADCFVKHIEAGDISPDDVRELSRRR